MKLRVRSVMQAVVFLGLIAVALPYLASRWFDPAAIGLAWRVARHPRLDREMRLVDLRFFFAEHDDHHLAVIHGLLR